MGKNDFKTADGFCTLVDECGLVGGIGVKSGWIGMKEGEDGWEGGVGINGRIVDFGRERLRWCVMMMSQPTRQSVINSTRFIFFNILSYGTVSE